MGASIAVRGAARLDVSGHYLAPGFVDVHSHSDLTVLANPGLESKITQGVTTEVVGNCGSTPYPVSPSHLDELRTYIDSFFPDVTRRTPWDWTDLSGWSDRVGVARPATNLAPLIGHGSLRIAVAGFHNRPLDASQQQDVRDRLISALDQGAFGFSTGLAYSPELGTRPEDLAPLLRLVAERDGVYATHQRDEGRHVVDSVRESLAIARDSGVRLEISHLKCLGRSQWGTAARLLGEIAAARGSGARVYADFYPYRAGETTLTAFLPGWVFEGTWAETESRLRDPTARERIRHDVEAGVPGWTIAADHLRWTDVVISVTGSGGSPSYLGRAISEIAESEGREPLELVLDLLLRERGAVSVLVFGADVGDVAAIGNDSMVLVGSDGIGNSIASGPLFGPIHPRNYGTFPRFLSTTLNDELPLAVRRITSLPCNHFGIPERGSILPGFVADLVTWSPERKDEGPTYGETPRYATLFDSVWVGGTPAVWKGAITGRRTGKLLRRVPRVGT